MTGKRLESPRYIPQVVYGIVQKVPTKRFDGKTCPVGARTCPRPLVVAHLVEGVGQAATRLAQRIADRHGVVLPVTLGDGSGVLIPVQERRILLREHQTQALVKQHEHIAHVAPVLEGGPDDAPIRPPGGTLAHQSTTAEDLMPGPHVCT